MTKLKFGKPLCRSIMAVAMMMLSLQAMAYDFSYTHQEKTLYYNRTSGNTVAVTYYNSNNYVSGDVVIPSTVIYNGTTYSVTSIGNSAFSGCSGLTSVAIPTGVSSIGGRAFSGCSSLTSVTIPTGVSSIGDDAFAYCSGLTSVTIPNSVTSIGKGPFAFCSALTSINVASGNTHYSSMDGVLYNYVQDTLIQCPAAKTSVTIPTGVSSIGESAFSGCYRLTSVTIPNSVTSIGKEAFGGCSGLTSVTIPNSVTSIGKEAFAYCSGLTSVTIPNNVTSIGEYAFSGCSGLTSITIPTGVTSIGGGAFSGCSGLTSINVASGNTHYSSIDGVLYNYVQDTLILCPEAKTSVTIPNSVTFIGESAFRKCSGLTSVTIPNSVTSIGEYAFWKCSGLTSVTIPNSVTSIGKGVFEDCNGLTSVTIPNNVTSIGEYAFSGCSGLTSITIPTGVTSIGSTAFVNCSSLTTLNFNAINCQDFSSFYSPFGTSLTTVNIGDSVQRIPADFVSSCSSLTSVTIGNSVTSIGDDAFAYCRGLTSVTIPTGVTSIGGGAFYGCSGLTSVTIPNSVTSIGYSAFTYCRGLTSVTIPTGVTYIFSSTFFGCGLTSVIIPNSVTHIGSYAFYGCRGLTSVRCLAVTPPSIDNTLFYNVPTTCTLTVPCGSIGAYAGSDWNEYFAGRISEEFVFEFTAAANDATFGSVAVSTGESCNEKIMTATPESCYRFVAWNDGNTNNPRTIRVTQDTTLTANFERAVYTQAISHAICEGSVYTENGFNVSEAGTYTQNLQTINGCDSIVALNLTVNPVASTTLSAAICEGSSYTENGFNANETGTYTQNLQTIDGCDSIVTLTLTVNPVANTTLSAAICEGSVYTENGFNASEAGTYTQNLQTVNGCDSIVMLTLTVNPVEGTTLSAAICEGSSYTENGFNASEAGTYTQNLQTVNGCDSIVTLTLAVNPVESTNLTAAICEGSSYTENGFNVSEAGTYTQNLQTVNGCDSIVTLTLTVNPVESTNLTAAICEGSAYTENGFNVSEAGTYTQTLQTINGCDSIVTLTLTVNPIENTTLSATICEGSAYTENGFNVNEAGTYTQNLQTVDGCDSIVTLNLIVNPTYNITIDASINEGETYEENGFSESEAGTYVHTLQSEFGCDSLITLNLTVNSSLNDVVANAIEVSLYPNPANAYTTLKVEGLKEQTPVYLFDIQGCKLKEYIMNIGQETLQIDLGDLPKGVYTITIGNTTKKLIVE